MTNHANSYFNITKSFLLLVSQLLLLKISFCQNLQYPNNFLKRLDTNFLATSAKANTDNTINTNGYNYLTNIYAELNELNKDTNNFIRHGEILATYLSYVGDYYTATTLADSVYFLQYKDIIKKRKELTKSFLDSLQLLPATDTILKYAKEARVIMFSEAHHKPQHRLITKSYLQQLKKIGYTAIAFETLNTIPKFSKPYNYENGFYMAEPYYADLVNYACQLGFKIIVYDTARNVTTNTTREKSAFTVLNKYLENNAQSKLIVHVGYGHNVKFMLPNFSMLGGLLNEKYKTISISQTQITDGYSIAPEVIYSHLSQKHLITTPQLLYKTNKPFSIKFNDVDFILLTPKIEHFDSTFLNTYCNMNKAKIVLNQQELSKGVYCQIFSTHNTSTTNLSKLNPLANFIITPSQYSYDVILSKSTNYLLVVRNNHNIIISKRRVNF